MNKLLNQEITKCCLKCGKLIIFRVNSIDFVNWQNNNYLIQNAFPYLNKANREILISGICNDCFNNMFPEE